MRFYKGDRVRVKKNIQTSDPETQSYVDSFGGKVGQIFDITTSTAGVPSFHVNFGKEIGIFYENEIEYVTE